MAKPPKKIYLTFPDYPDGRIGEILTEAPQCIPFTVYVNLFDVTKTLEKLKEVCGKSAMRYVEKRIEELKNY